MLSTVRYSEKTRSLLIQKVEEIGAAFLYGNGEMDDGNTIIGITNGSEAAPMLIIGGPFP